MAPELEKLEAENVRLRERVAFLERGADVVARAEEYASLFAAYEEQVARLAAALERERKRVRELVGLPPTAE